MQCASRGWRKVNCLLWRLGVKLSFVGLDENSGARRVEKRDSERRWDRIKDCYVQHTGIV